LEAKAQAVTGPPREKILPVIPKEADVERETMGFAHEVIGESCTSATLKSSMSNKDEKTPPESLTLRIVATDNLKSIRTLVERHGGVVADQADRRHSDLKKLDKQQGAVRKKLKKS
jgi:hypothetical protein